MVTIASYQRESIADQGCIVLYSWSVSTSNIGNDNISHFVVTFDGTTQKVATTQANIYIILQSVHTCASHNITIFAVDSCGRNGPPQHHVVIEVSNTTDRDSNNETSTDMFEDRCEGTVQTLTNVTDYD